MKFIFPKNYTTRFKLFGFMDYTTAILNVIWIIFLFCILDFFPFSFKTNLFLIILFSFPIILLSIFGFADENIVCVLSYIIFFYRKRNIYLYK